MAVVVLVHGAWHDATSWTPMVAAWPDDPSGVEPIDLPSTAGRGSLSGDASALVAVCANRGPLVLVGHSYGGAVCTEAAGRISELVGVVYLAAFRPSPGQSVNESARGVADRADIGRFTVPLDDDRIGLGPGSEGVLYGDARPALVAEMVAHQHPQPRATFIEPVTSDVPDGVATSYLVCARDRTVPPALQRLFAARCDEAIELDLSHFPQLEAPSTSALTIAEVARRMVDGV